MAPTKKDVADAPVETPVEAVAPAPAIDADRQTRWAAFIESARSQRSGAALEVFEAQEKAGEFNVIPDDFK